LNSSSLKAALETLDPLARDDLRRALIHDQADRDAISSPLMRYRDRNGQDWVDIIDFLTMNPEARQRVARLPGEIGPPRHLDLGPVNTLLTDLRLACEVDRDPHSPANLDDPVPCSPVAAVEHVGPVVRRPHERPKDGPDGWPLADVLPPAATARRPREGAVEEASALRHQERLPLGRRAQTRALDELRQVVPVPRGVGHRREPSLRPVERRRRRSEHEHASEGDRERAPHVRPRRNCTSTTCTQRDRPSWTKRSHRQPPLWGSEGAMQPIVDLRLVDVYRVADVRVAQ